MAKGFRNILSLSFFIVNGRSEIFQRTVRYTPVITSPFEEASLPPLTMASLSLLNTEILRDFLFFLS